MFSAKRHQAAAHAYKRPNGVPMIDPRVLTREQAQYTKDHLEAAKKLLEKEGGWIKGNFAVNAEGRRVETTDEDACSFCALGAIYRTMEPTSFGDGETYLSNAADCLEFILRRRGTRGWDQGYSSENPSVAVFNDYPNTTHEKVLKLFQDGIDELSAILAETPLAGGG